MVNKKIKLIVGFVAAITIAMGSFAAELSESALDQCENYINNPTAELGKNNAAALTQCYQQNVCQNQLSGVSHCAKNLNLWYAAYSSPKPNIASPAVPVQAPAANTNAIPAEFHSTQPTTPAVVTTPAPMQATPQQTESQSTATTTPEQKKETKPKINWF